jgi:hypothetical protein
MHQSDITICTYSTCISRFCIIPTSDSHKVLIWNSELTFRSKAAFNMTSSRHQKLPTMWPHTPIKSWYTNAEIIFGSKVAFNMIPSRHQRLTTVWYNAGDHADISVIFNWWLGRCDADVTNMSHSGIPMRWYQCNILLYTRCTNVSSYYQLFFPINIDGYPHIIKIYHDITSVWRCKLISHRWCSWWHLSVW